MKLLSFSVTNYRSITKAHKINLSDLTVLIGKNNEGKSNLLTALNLAMNMLLMSSSRFYGRGIIRRPIRPRDNVYEWSRDFPIQLQQRKGVNESIFKLDFQLNDEEYENFKKNFSLHGDNKITIEIKIGKENKSKITIPKKGTSAYNKLAQNIIEFISTRISFNYIRAIRTEDLATDALLDIISGEIRALELNEEYKHASEVINNLQRKALNSISKKLKEPLKVFLPQLKDIKILKDIDEPLPRFYRGDLDIIIDDGIPTSIAFKGDGIKSLVALAILKDRKLVEGASIIAIEEPESHLHSGAIHGLVDVINKISENSQVLITTHNPLFVQRDNIKSNIIVDNGTAHQAKDIREIRDILGVLPEDNLINSSNVLVVEGDNDKIALNKILCAKSSLLKDCLKNGRLAIKTLNGVANLSHCLNELKDSICNYFVLIDNDSAALDAKNKAESLNILKPSEIKLTICNGMTESEFEDCINPKIYEEKFFSEYGVNLKCKEFHNNKKWSARVRDVFLSQGVLFTEEIEMKLKNIVANSIPDKLENSLIPQKSTFITSLISNLERMVKKNLQSEQSD